MILKNKDINKFFFPVFNKVDLKKFKVNPTNIIENTIIVINKLDEKLNLKMASPTLRGKSSL